MWRNQPQVSRPVEGMLWTPVWCTVAARPGKGRVRVPQCDCALEPNSPVRWEPGSPAVACRAHRLLPGPLACCAAWMNRSACSAPG
jgi:hypothetical protein